MPKARLLRTFALAVAVLGAGAGTAHAEQSAVPSGATLTLVGVEAINTYSPANWTVDTAGKTMVGTFHWGTGTYRYNIPAVIPPGGAQGSLVMSIQATQLWATGFSLEGDADFSPPPAIDEVTSKRGLSFSHEVKFTVKPRAYSAGTKFVEFIGKAYYDEGPRFTFRYAVKAKPKPGVCRRVARSTAALSTADANTAFCGVTLRIDSPKGVASPWLEVKKRVAFTAAATGMDVEAPLRLVIRWRDPDARPSRDFKELSVGCVVGQAKCVFWSSSSFPRAIEFQAVLMLDSDELYRSDVVHVRWVPELKKLSFDYTVPPRLEQKKPGDPVDYVNGGAKAQPDGWPVDLVVANCPDPAKNTYLWEYASPNAPAKALDLPAKRTSRCTWRAKLPGGKGGVEGTFQVTLKVDAHAGLQKYEGKRAVLLQDFLVIGMGDSLGSGEGNPESGTGAGAKWQNERCDRSSLSYQALAALAIERADEKTSVTFVHLACSGASILDSTTTGTKGGVLAPYEGIHAASPPLKPQLEVATKLIGAREVDAVLLSAGVNDLEFGNLVSYCAFPLGGGTATDAPGADCFDRPYTDKAGQYHAQLLEFLPDAFLLLPEAYRQLKGALRSFGPNNSVPSKRVLITQYPDLLNDDHGTLCPGLDLGTESGFTIKLGVTEVQRLSTLYLAPLNAAVAATGSGTDPWSVVGLGSGFTSHGYCAAKSWIVQRPESIAKQGNDYGALHPNRAGHEWIGAAVAKELKAQLLPGGKPRKPR